MTVEINLPPLPKGDIAADTCPVMWVHTDQQIESYATAAIELDRQGRGEPTLFGIPHSFSEKCLCKHCAPIIIPQPPYTSPENEQTKIDGPFTMDIDSYEPGFRDINRPGHTGFMRVVWKMEDDDRSPECEEAAQFVLNALNAAWSGQQDADKVGSLPTKIPSQSREPILRAMATNYSRGHSWDHLDSDVCQKAADEIRDLRALLSDQAKPDPVKAGDDLRNLVSRLREADKPLMQQCTFSEVRDLLREASDALERVQPASGDSIDTLQHLLEGKTVSMDVSTGDHDAGHRIYGKVYCVQEDSDDGYTVLAIEESRNFSHLPWGQGLQVR